MNGTIYMPVGEVCSSISDTYREKKNMVTLINTSDVLEGRVLNHERVPNSNLKGQFKKTFQRDDILYSEIRPQNRRFAYVDFSPIDYIASTKLMVIRAKKDVVSPKYLYYFLKNSSTVAELQLLAETRSGTFPQITFSEVANLTIPVPSLAVQEVIVQTMQCLEDKITCNEQINDNLQQQAAALFSSLYDRSNTEVRFTDLIQILGGGTPKTGENTYWNGNIAFFTPKDVGIPYTLITEKTISNYSDDLVSFLGLLDFMNHFNSAKDIEQDFDMQPEYCNSCICQRLETHFEQMKNKLPVEPVKDQEKDFFRNRRGAKVYHDVDRQPILELTKGKNAFVVLSVGIAKGGIPLVTVEASPENLCYRLPVQLNEWAMTLVSMANTGEDLFPAEVIFTKAENRIYADIM